MLKILSPVFMAVCATIILVFAVSVLLLHVFGA